MAAELVRKPNRLKGMKLRDEFVCPITFEVMSDPVVASDGHTYEKSAIEKWLRSSTKSPRNGEPITRMVISNLNLKKLIQDMISEGGSGLYTVDIADHSRLFDVYPEKIIYMKCLGPPESDWNGNSFSVTPYGCLGGRKVVNPLGREVVSFRDSTVSRMHFEVMCDASTKKYMIRDLGSAGGTFIRIPYGERKELHPGMMLLIGKHQFTVSSIDTTRPKEGVANSASAGPGGGAGGSVGAGAGAGAAGGSRQQQTGGGFFTPPAANSPAPGAGPGVRAPAPVNRVASRPGADAGEPESDAGAMIDSIVNEASLLIQQLSGGGDEASAAVASAVAAAAAENGGGDAGSGSDPAAAAADANRLLHTVVGDMSGVSASGAKDIDSRLKVLSNKMSHLRMINSNNQQHMAAPPSAPMPSSAASSSASYTASAPQPLSSMEEADTAGEQVHSPLRKRQNVNKDSDLSGQRQPLTCEATMNFSSSRSDSSNNNDPSALPAPPPGASQAMDEGAQGGSSSGANSGMARNGSSANLSAAGDNEGDGSGGEDAESTPTSKRCTITCFAPDGSPMQGRAFVVDSEGAMIGRKFGNKIPMYVFVVEADKAAAEKAARESGAAPVSLTPTKIVNIDNAVSAEHARIEMDPKTGKFYVMDGTASRSSTNGTWVRLSGPCQESPFTPVKSSTEILVGTVRFIVSESMTILEKAVDSNSSTTGASAGSAVKTHDQV